MLRNAPTNEILLIEPLNHTIISFLCSFYGLRYHIIHIKEKPSIRIYFTELQEDGTGLVWRLVLQVRSAWRSGNGEVTGAAGAGWTAVPTAI